MHNLAERSITVMTVVIVGSGQPRLAIRKDAIETGKFSRHWQVAWTRWAGRQSGCIRCGSVRSDVGSGGPRWRISRRTRTTGGTHELLR